MTPKHVYILNDFVQKKFKNSHNQQVYVKMLYQMHVFANQLEVSFETGYMAPNLKEYFTLFKHMPILLQIICKSFSQEEVERKQKLKYQTGRSSRMLRSEIRSPLGLQKRPGAHSTLNLSVLELHDTKIDGHSPGMYHPKSLTKTNQDPMSIVKDIKQKYSNLNASRHSERIISTELDFQNSNNHKGSLIVDRAGSPE